MKKLTFHILWPGGNTTALVTENFPREKYFKIARQILDQYKDVEQVGFLEKPKNKKADIHLQMMGGEFCGNAARAASFFWALQNKNKSVKLTVSGFPELLSAKINSNQVELKLPGNFFQKIKNGKIQIIDLMGIRFISQSFPKDLTKAQKLIKKHKDIFPAVGVLYIFSEDKNITIDPIVWVRETNTCYNETACGSGSIAASIAKFIQNPKNKNFSVIQPSGKTYNIKIESHNQTIIKIKFSGIIEYKGKGEINLA